MISISDIDKELKQLNINDLNLGIDKYREDSRTGVIKLLEKYQKKLDKYYAELERTEKLKEFEKKYSDYEFIAGIDEVGRGPLAGPVVAGVVILPKDCDILYINDSKKLSEKKREELYDIIVEKAVAYATAVVSPQRID